MSIYDGHEGSRLFDWSHFSPGVRQYRQVENALIRRTLQKYSKLVEIGCGAGDNVSTALDFSKTYVGVEPSTYLISMGEDRFRSDPEIKFLNKSFIEFQLTDLSISNERDFIVFIPFNCLGNMPDPTAALEHLNELGCDFVVSIFRSNELARLIRHTYCRRSGFFGDFVKSVYGDKYICEKNWESIGFDEMLVRKIIDQIGMQTSIINLGEAAFAVVRTRS